MPSGLKERLAAIAKENGRSLNTEIVMILESAVAQYEQSHASGQILGENHGIYITNLGATHEDRYGRKDIVKSGISEPPDYIKIILDRLEAVEKKIKDK